MPALRAGRGHLIAPLSADDACGVDYPEAGERDGYDRQQPDALLHADGEAGTAGAHEVSLHHRGFGPGMGNPRHRLRCRLRVALSCCSFSQTIRGTKYPLHFGNLSFRNSLNSLVGFFVLVIFILRL